MKSRLKIELHFLLGNTNNTKCTSIHLTVVALSGITINHISSRLGVLFWSRKDRVSIHSNSSAIRREGRAGDIIAGFPGLEPALIPTGLFFYLRLWNSNTTMPAHIRETFTMASSPGVQGEMTVWLFGRHGQGRVTSAALASVGPGTLLGSNKRLLCHPVLSNKQKETGQNKNNDT